MWMFEFLSLSSFDVKTIESCSDSMSGGFVFRPVSDGRFGSLSFLPGDVFVKVRQAARHRLGDVTQLGPADHVSLQEVGQRALQRPHTSSVKTTSNHWCFLTTD